MTTGRMDRMTDKTFVVLMLVLIFLIFFGSFIFGLDIQIDKSDFQD